MAYTQKIPMGTVVVFVITVKLHVDHVAFSPAQVESIPFYNETWWRTTHEPLFHIYHFNFGWIPQWVNLRNKKMGMNLIDQKILNSNK